MRAAFHLGTTPNADFKATKKGDIHLGDMPTLAAAYACMCQSPLPPHMPASVLKSSALLA